MLLQLFSLYRIMQTRKSALARKFLLSRFSLSEKERRSTGRQAGTKTLMKISKGLCRGLAFSATSVFAISTVAGTALEAYSNRVDDFLGTKSYDLKVDASQEIYSADYDDTDSLIAASKELYEEISGEGTVMLKNQNLPLAAGAKVTLLGLRSSDDMALYTDGARADQTVTLYDAMTQAGFQVNPTMHDIYNTLSADTRFNAGAENAWNGDNSLVVNYLKANLYGIEQGTEGDYVYHAAEPTVDDLTATDASCMDSVAEYKDAAVVVVGRPNVEGGDYYAGTAGIDADSGARNPFALTNDEKDLIDFAKQNFDKVVVLLNTVSDFELADLEADPDIDGILWVGMPGNYGYLAVANIMNGTINPSGKLTDTYASDSASAPAMQNFGSYYYTNADEMIDGTLTGEHYVVEAEGIYQGYRYYETRYADCVMGQGNANSAVGTFDSTDGWNYDEEVVYPFGYGESYTTFTQKMDDLQVSADHKSLTAKVTVTNTGSVAGKDAVELYASAPYTPGGIEKSAVQLLNYEKTDLLQPGQSQQVEITADLQNLASYDYQNAKTYVLDAGTYYFAVGNGAHEAVNNVLAAMGYTTENGMDAEGNAEAVKSWENSAYDATTFATSETGVQVTNQLDNIDLNTYQPSTVTYLSRGDWAGTWPKTYDDIAITDEMAVQLKNDTYQISDSDDTSNILFNQKGDLSFFDMAGAAYDDPRWEQLLNQMDLQEAIRFIVYGNRNYREIPTIGFLGATMTENGPFGFATMLSTNSRSGSSHFVSAEDKNAAYNTRDGAAYAVVGATFNHELQHDLGVMWGNISLFNGMPMLWGGSMNLHRTTYNGRNHEYFSEDPILTGYASAEIVSGAKEKGMIQVIKHFAFNDQCSNQQGVSTFLNEQCARELELRGFQIAVEDGGALGIMTSYNRAGITYSSANKNLITNVLKDEWGFRGYTITDWGTDYKYMTFKEALAAGTTGFDFPEMPQDWNSYVTDTTNAFANDATMLTAIKEAVHESLYTFANSNLMNYMNSSTQYIELNVWWRVLYKTLKYVSLVIGVAGMAGYVYASRKETEGGKEA